MDGVSGSADDSLPSQSHEGRLYPRCAIPEYWIVNLVERVLEVHRDPMGEEGEESRYRSVAKRGEKETIVLDLAEGAEIAVANLLP